jgi:energy-coupling factor transport system ATP-binding protein
MSYIQIENLDFYYRRAEKLLSGFNLDIERGEMIALLGRNGSGKSTFARLLTGLLKARKGVITIDGVVLDEKTVHGIRKKIGIVFQNPDNQFVGMTVEEDIAFGMENRNVAQPVMIEKIDHYLGIVKMTEFKNHNPERLSGGQKQRVAIASVLALDCEIIVFDEATSMLDPQGVLEVMEVIKEIKTDKTVIIITHDLREARLADRVAILDEGQIVAIDTPEKIFTDIELLTKARLETLEEVKIYNLLKDKEFANKEKILEAIWKKAFQK